MAATLAPVVRRMERPVYVRWLTFTNPVYKEAVERSKRVAPEPTEITAEARVQARKLMPHDGHRAMTVKSE